MLRRRERTARISLAAAACACALHVALGIGCNDQPTQAAVPVAPPRGTRVDAPLPSAGQAAAGPKLDAEAPPVASVPPRATTIENAPAAAAVPAENPPSSDAGAVSSAGPVLKPGAKTGPLGAPDPVRQGYTRVSFNELASFEYDPFDAGVPMHGATPDEAAAAIVTAPQDAERIPANVLALGGKKIALQGFMMPIEIKRNQVKSFLLVRNQMACCFGMMLGFNEWVFVRCAEDKPAEFVPDVLITAYGDFEVGEEISGGAVMSIFRMRCDEVLHSGGN